jgi:glycosyltransferase involved in cell wall biosynthesis
MKVAHVCSTLDREANGMSKAVLDMTASLASLDCDVEVYTTGDPPPRSTERVPIHCHQSWQVPRKLLVSPTLRTAVESAAEDADVIHSHGLWTLPPAYALRAALRTRRPTVVTAHGAFNPWPLSQSRLQKRIIWSLIHRRLFRKATCLHATADAEVTAYRQMRLKAPIAVIPLGIEIPETLSNREQQPFRKLLFLGRLHPKKGIELLLPAWKQVQDAASDWELHIVGPGEDAYVAHLQEMARSLGCKRVNFRGPVYGNEKNTEYRSADAFVLTTLDENFGLAVAEALAHGVPALVTHGAPWSGLTSRKCGWWVDISVPTIAGALSELTIASSGELSQMGAAGRKWMREDFSIDSMGRKLRELYAWLLGGGNAPTFVHQA